MYNPFRLAACPHATKFRFLVLPNLRGIGQNVSLMGSEGYMQDNRGTIVTNSRGPGAQRDNRDSKG